MENKIKRVIIALLTTMSLFSTTAVFAEPVHPVVHHEYPKGSATQGQPDCLYFMLTETGEDYPFEADFYMQKYPDVAAMYGHLYDGPNPKDPTDYWISDRTNALAEHYVSVGQFEGRIGCPEWRWFNEEHSKYYVWELNQRRQRDGLPPVKYNEKASRLAYQYSSSGYKFDAWSADDKENFILTGAMNCPVNAFRYEGDDLEVGIWYDHKNSNCVVKWPGGIYEYM